MLLDSLKLIVLFVIEGMLTGVIINTIRGWSTNGIGNNIVTIALSLAGMVAVPYLLLRVFRKRN